MYHEILDDPKIGMMSDTDQLLWIKALCLASVDSERGKISLSEDEIAFKLRVSPETWNHAKDKFRAKGLIEQDGIGKITIVNWAKRQFESDNSSERVRKHREAKASAKKDLSQGDKSGTTKQAETKMKRFMKQSCNVSETPPDPYTEIRDQIQTQRSDPDPHTQSGSSARALREKKNEEKILEIHETNFSNPENLVQPVTHSAQQNPVILEHVPAVGTNVVANSVGIADPMAARFDRRRLNCRELSQDKEFIACILKFLQSTPSGKEKRYEVPDAVSWILNGTYNAQRYDNVEARFTHFQNERRDAEDGADDESYIRPPQEGVERENDGGESPIMKRVCERIAAKQKPSV